MTQRRAAPRRTKMTPTPKRAQRLEQQKGRAEQVQAWLEERARVAAERRQARHEPGHEEPEPEAAPQAYDDVGTVGTMRWSAYGLTREQARRALRAARKERRRANRSGADEAPG